MDKLKQYVVLTVVASLVVLAAGWFLLVSPKRSQAADLRTQAAAQVTANAQLETQLQVLKAQAKDLPKQQARLAAVAAKIPSNPALPALVRALTTASTSAGVELISVTPSSPTLVAGAAPTAGTAPAATAPAATGSTVAAPAVDAGQLAAIPLTLNVVGGYFQVEQFVSNLESLPRSMRVTNLKLVPGTNPVKPTTTATVPDGKTLVTTVTGMVYMAANRAAPTAVTLPGQGVVGTGATNVTPAGTSTAPVK
jgi:Tfp pilus assembly protein PilO